MPLDAMTISHTTGIAAAFSQAVAPPTAWVAGRNDLGAQVEDFDANRTAIEQSGVRNAFFINEPTPVAPDSFTRIPGVSASLSASIEAALDGAALLDACGLQVNDPDSSGWEAAMPPLAAPFEQQIRIQLRELHASHTFTSDYSAEILEFLDPSSPVPALPSAALLILATLLGSLGFYRARER
jgi:hypothetical protein